MRHILIDSEGRLRTGWRLFVFGAILVLVQGVLTLLLAQVVDPRVLLGEGLGSANPGVVLAQAVGVVSVTLAVYIARRWLDRRSFRSLGLDTRGPWLQHLFWGTVLAIGLQALIFVVQLAAGWLVIESFGWRGGGTAVTGLLVLGIAFVAVSWNEELLTRGYLLQNLEHGLGTVAAVLISSLLFGFLHIFNENASIIATLGVAFAGILLAVSYLVTRQLWLAIGIHFGWNFAEGPIFGFPVSGLDAGGLITHRVTGPEAITGGAFGPEAGLISIAAELVGIGVLLWWWRSRPLAR